MSGSVGHHARRVGDFVVTAISDGVLQGAFEVLVGIEGADAAAMMAAAGRPGAPALSVNCYVVQGGGRTVLIDTGAAGSMGPGLGRLLPNLVAAGISPESVDLVLLTHIHPDHSNGLSVEGRAVFPNAGLGFHEAEGAFWLAAGRAEAAPAERRPYFEQAAAMVGPYAARVTHAAEAVPGIVRVDMPGHTPGHSGYRIGVGAESLLIWGDVMHVPDIQAPRPGVGVVYDTDPAEAIATRKRVLAEVAAAGTLVAGMHLHFPGFVRVARDGEGYRLTPDA